MPKQKPRYKTGTGGDIWTPAEIDWFLERVLPFTGEFMGMFVRVVERGMGRGNTTEGGNPPLGYRKLWGLALRLKASDYQGPCYPDSRTWRCGPLSSVERLVCHIARNSETEEKQVAPPDLPYIANLLQRGVTDRHLLRVWELEGPTKGRGGFGVV